MKHTKTIKTMLVMLSAVSVLSACGPKCDGVYTIAQNKKVGDMVDGKINATDLKPDFNRRLLSADGSYAGTKVYCNANAARSDYLDSAKSGRITVPGEWSVLKLKAEWDEAVYPYRTADWRLKQAVMIEQEMERHGTGN